MKTLLILLAISILSTSALAEGKRKNGISDCEIVSSEKNRTVRAHFKIAPRDGGLITIPFMPNRYGKNACYAEKAKINDFFERKSFPFQTCGCSVRPGSKYSPSAIVLACAEFKSDSQFLVRREILVRPNNKKGWDACEAKKFAIQTRNPAGKIEKRKVVKKEVKSNKTKRTAELFLILIGGTQAINGGAGASSK